SWTRSPRSPTPLPWPCTPDWSVDRGLSRNRWQSSGRQDLDYLYVSDNIVVCATGASALWSIGTRTVCAIEDGSPLRHLRIRMKTTIFPKTRGLGCTDESRGRCGCQGGGDIPVVQDVSEHRPSSPDAAVVNADRSPPLVAPRTGPRHRPRRAARPFRSERHQQPPPSARTAS